MNALEDPALSVFLGGAASGDGYFPFGSPPRQRRNKHTLARSHGHHASSYFTQLAFAASAVSPDARIAIASLIIPPHPFCPPHSTSIRHARWSGGACSLPGAHAHPQDCGRDVRLVQMLLIYSHEIISCQHQPALTPALLLRGARASGHPSTATSSRWPACAILLPTLFLCTP